MDREISTFEEEEIIKLAEKQLATRNHLRRMPLLFGLVGLGMCLWVGSGIVSKLQDLPAEELLLIYHKRLYQNDKNRTD